MSVILFRPQYVNMKEQSDNHNYNLTLYNSSCKIVVWKKLLNVRFTSLDGSFMIYTYTMHLTPISVVNKEFD